MLTSEQVTEFRSRFEKERQAILFPDETLKQKVSSDVIQGPTDETDQAQAETEQSIQMQLRNREQLYLKKIEEALAKIEAGTYGECESCGEPIGLKRLMARPTATMCIDCKQEEERSERHSTANFTHKSLGDVFVMQ